MFIKGQHYELFENNKDVLVITYAPVNLPLGQLPHYKSVTKFKRR